MGYKELENHRPEVRDLEKLEENPTSSGRTPWLPSAILVGIPCFTILFDSWIQYIGLAWGLIGWGTLTYLISKKFFDGGI